MTNPAYKKGHSSIRNKEPMVLWSSPATIHIMWFTLTETILSVGKIEEDGNWEAQYKSKSKDLVFILNPMKAALS